MWRHPSSWSGTSPRTPCAIASVSSLWLVARFAHIAQVGVGTRLICTYCNGVLMMSRTYAHVCSFSHLQPIPLYRNKHKIRHYCGSRHWRHMVREKHCTHWYLWIENVDIKFHIVTHDSFYQATLLKANRIITYRLSNHCEIPLILIHCTLVSVKHKYESTLFWRLILP